MSKNMVYVGVLPLVVGLVLTTCLGSAWSMEVLSDAYLADITAQWAYERCVDSVGFSCADGCQRCDVLDPPWNYCDQRSIDYYYLCDVSQDPEDQCGTWWEPYCRLTPRFVAAGLDAGLAGIHSATAEVELTCSFPGGREMQGAKLREAQLRFRWACENNKLSLVLLDHRVLMDDDDEKQTLDSQYQFIIDGCKAYCYTNNALLQAVGRQTEPTAYIGDVQRLASREGFSRRYPQADPRWWGWYYATQKISKLLTSSKYRISLQDYYQSEERIRAELATPGLHTVFWLDAGRNFIVRRIQEDTIYEGRRQRTFSLEVSKVSEQDGVYLPIAGTRTLYRDGQASSIFSFNVKDLQLNLDVPDNLFSFDVPPGTHVIDWTKAKTYVEESEAPPPIP